VSAETYLSGPLVTPGPLPDGLDLPYHEGLRDHRLVLPHCRSCGTWTWPPDVVCWNCHTFGLDWAETRPEGRIYSWTRVWHPARPELASDVPYIIALVELPQASGVRLIGNLLGPGDQAVACGTPVTGVFEDSAAGDFTLLQWTIAVGG
jgi:uncharacterized OB-fold protein